MALATSGTMAKTVEAWERLIASSATLQTLFSAATAAAAKERIHWYEVNLEPDDQVLDESPEQQPRITTIPFAIADATEDSRERAGVAEWSSRGSVVLTVVVAVPDDYKIDRGLDTNDQIRSKEIDRKVWGTNQAGNIRDEIIANSGLADANLDPYLNVTVLTLNSGPGPVEDDDAYDYIAFTFVGTWEG